MRWTGFSALFMWITCVCSTKERYDARVTVKNEGISRFPFESHTSGLVKLVGTSASKTIWVGKNRSLYFLKPAEDFRPKLVNVRLYQNETLEEMYRLSLLSQSADGNLLFFCGSVPKNTKCCYLNAAHSPTDCFELEYELDINEPSLLVGRMLYFTMPDMGLYKINVDNKFKIWPQTTKIEQRHLKLVAGKGRHDDKVYSFFAEKQKSKDGDSEHWVPRVSQSCMNDLGGAKGQLQNSWTSTIYSRLICGRGDDFSRLVDVATLETDDDTKVYALFRNYWNMSAVCVYSMSKISNVFNSSGFIATGVPAYHRPGTCVSDSTSLKAEVLMFMKDRPEMKDGVTPENEPLLFKHRHYTHIQVDREETHTVLLLSLESGGVHKVLEDPVFVIAEYLTFPRGTHITGMLLDANEKQKRLFVGSSNELVQIDLRACHVYGDECSVCFLSRDPHCGWNGSLCKSRFSNSSDCSAPSAQPSKTEPNAETVLVPPSSRHFLPCPMTSHHATYQWHRGHTREECVRSDQGCLYLIESMNATHEGSYRCVSSEDDYQRTVARYQLSMSRSNAQRLAPAALLLLTAAHFLFQTSLSVM